MSQATAANATIKNTNRWSTRQLVTMALMCAIAALLSFVQIPILPAAPFLTYDPSLMPAMVCGFAFGPGAGFAVGAVAAIIHSLMLGEWVGGLMNICATLFFVVPAAAIYAHKHTFAGAIIGLLVGCVVATIGAVGATPSLQAHGLGMQDFLKILLTQLTFQDPLKPMDNQAFMAQMAQFTALEQTQQLNAKIDALLATQAATIDDGLDHLELYTSGGLLTLLWHGPAEAEVMGRLLQDLGVPAASNFTSAMVNPASTAVNSVR